VGVWTHLASVFDPASGTIKFYVNGTLVAAKAGLSTWPARGPFEVGRTMWADAFGSYFAGDIDNVRVFAGALSDGDVVDLANQ
jgi:Concanavalin A-like lectin/glucanases superfamily